MPVTTSSTTAISTAPRLKLDVRGGQNQPRTEPIVIPQLGPEEARRQAKEKLAAAYRIFHKLGYDFAVAGHITLRDPVDPHAFWLAPFSIPFDHVCASDLLLIDHNGNVIAGGKPGDGQLYNAAGFAIHGALHMGRPDINAAAHAHSQFGKAFSAMGRNLDMASHVSSTTIVADKLLSITEAAAFSETIRLYNEFGGVVLTDEESQRIVNAMGEHGKAMILRNHGIISVGKTLESAIAYYVRLEQLCESQLMADAAGVSMPLEERDETDIFALYGGEEEAYFEAQKLFQAIERETGGAYKL
ncbi:hypothetical protein EHS25_001642 [Saitozyma podzolica]|uniref:Class II aldolase/adducin N-terminal domain-containing protein n=1 Tax=Saitozyma podzolica TaxID=1890683 RepID=A0A427YGU9_9TREE|nr:hypothetical protein EHS25_001642 [Saitozyma podzolica]